MPEGICYIVGAGRHFPGDTFAPAPEDLVIAADGGYADLLSRGIRVDLLLGDMDSLGEKIPQGPSVERFAPQKDDTDTLLAIKTGLQRGYRAFHLYGGTGGRLDHTLANCQCLLYLARRGARGWLHGEREVVTAVVDGELELPPRKAGYLSVFCLGDRAEGVTLEGLKYPLENAVLTADFPLGVSNEFTGAKSRIAVRHGALLVVLQTV